MLDFGLWFSSRRFWTRSSPTALFWYFWIIHLGKRWVFKSFLNFLVSRCVDDSSSVNYSVCRVLRSCFGSLCRHSLLRAAAPPLSWCPCTTTWSLSSTRPAITYGPGCFRAHPGSCWRLDAPTWMHSAETPRITTCSFNVQPLNLCMNQDPVLTCTA